MLVSRDLFGQLVLLDAARIAGCFRRPCGVFANLRLKVVRHGFGSVSETIALPFLAMQSVTIDDQDWENLTGSIRRLSLPVLSMQFRANTSQSVLNATSCDADAGVL